MATEILLILLSLCFFVYMFFKYSFSYWKSRGIPFLQPAPIIGNTAPLFKMEKSFGFYLTDIYNDPKFANDPVVGVYIFNRPVLVVRDLDIVKSILIKDFNKFSNRNVKGDVKADPLGCLNLFFMRNPEWKEARNKLSPVFTSGKIKQMYPLMMEIAGELEEHLASYKKSNNSFVAEVKEICALFTTDIIATIAFGVRANSLKNPDGEFRTEGRKMFQITLKQGIHAFIAFFLPHLSKIFKVEIFTHDFSRFVRKTVKFVLSERESSGNVRNDLIDTLLALKREAAADPSGKHFAKNMDFLAAQAAVFLTAGFETSSSTMSFALYELARNPDIQNRLREELYEAFKESNGVISYEKLSSLEYLGMVIDEVLRLYPVMPFLDREHGPPQGEAAFTLEPHYNYEMSNGMAVYVPIYGIHLDPKYWPNPNKFDPERFSPENKKSINPMTYLPFGTGPHNCIGMRVGLLQAKIGLAHILKNHYVTPCDKTIKTMKFNPKAVGLQCEEGIYLEIINDNKCEK